MDRFPTEYDQEFPNPYNEDDRSRFFTRGVGLGVAATMVVAGLAVGSYAWTQPTTTAPGHHATASARCGEVVIEWDDFTAEGQSVTFEVAWLVSLLPDNGASPFVVSGVEHFGPSSGSERIHLYPMNGVLTWSSSWNTHGHTGSGGGTLRIDDCEETPSSSSTSPSSSTVTTLTPPDSVPSSSSTTSPGPTTTSASPTPTSGSPSVPDTSTATPTSPSPTDAPAPTASLPTSTPTDDCTPNENNAGLNCDDSPLAGVETGWRSVNRAPYWGYAYTWQGRQVCAWYVWNGVRYRPTQWDYCGVHA